MSCNVGPIVRGQASNGSLPINAYVVGCTEPPCSLPQNQDVVIRVVFKAPRILHDMKTKVVAFLGIAVNYPLGQNEVTCNFLTNADCPVLEGEIVEYSLRMFIEPFFPTVPVTIEFRVEDSDAVPVWCIRLPIVIVRPQ
ncbi:ecdysteroid-regulated protein [Danaus plexippus plexippus]|uniref:Ecdysteroid-regulated protein n=1 Tax=Danaus plexippus plexippus TaxID=278856 RepID=A0A212FFA3_DANPL|nr:ecdysteroid-regulated protein [Danaus plexippus plexippus]